MSITFYTKQGRRYKPVSEYDDKLLSSYPDGAHLVVCKPGSTSTKYNVDPAFAPMIAAGRYAIDKLATAIVEGTIARPSITLNTEQQAAWDAFVATMKKEDISMISYPSAAQAAETIMKDLEQQSAQLLENPAVKISYDNFQLLSKLTLEKQK